MDSVSLTVYPEAAVVVLVLDNLNTHCIGSLYEAFDPASTGFATGNPQYTKTRELDEHGRNRIEHSVAAMP